MIRDRPLLTSRTLISGSFVEDRQRGSAMEGVGEIEPGFFPGFLKTRKKPG